MSIGEAAGELHARLASEGWFVTVGVTDAEVVVYVDGDAPDGVVPATIRGYPVRVVDMGRPTPARS